MIMQMCCHVVGATVFCGFTQRVFRPGARWARLITGATFAVIFGTALVQIQSPGLRAYVEQGSGIWHWHGAASTLPLLWAGAESQRYHGLMRRRQRIGLADPPLTDRFGLWAFATFSAALITIISICVESLGRSLAGTAFGGLVMGSLGSASAGAIWLAFLPPAAYRRRLQKPA